MITVSFLKGRGGGKAGILHIIVFLDVILFGRQENAERINQQATIALQLGHDMATEQS